MPWVFIIIGLVTSGSVLCRLAVASRGPRRSWPVEGVTLILLAVAWVAHHTTAIGWIALITAFAFELSRWIIASRAGGKTAPPAPLTPAKEPEPLDQIATPATSDPTDAPPAATMGSLNTMALLRVPWRAAPEVFLASLRRIGQRDAELLGDRPASEDQTRLRVGPTTLELVRVAAPVARDRLDYALAQAWDWPDAAGITARHVAHVVFATLCPADTPWTDVVRLHQQAHAALAEFAPVLAVLWPDAGRLIPTAALRDFARKAPDATSPTAACVCFRLFPLEGSDTGRFVSDTVGLHAFGLPDLQVVTDSKPDETVSNVIYELADRFFVAGSDIRDGDSISVDDNTTWLATRTRARFPPDREVVELSQRVS